MISKDMIDEPQEQNDGLQQDQLVPVPTRFSPLPAGVCCAFMYLVARFKRT